MTAQYDAKTDYRRRRKTKRQRRRGRARWKSKRRLINTVRNANIGTTHIVRRSLALINTSSGTSDACAYGLYGLNGTSTDTFNTSNDVGELFKEMDSTSWAAVNSGITSGFNHKIYSYHATAEYTIRNSSSTTDCIVEAYFIRGTKPVNYAFAMDPVQVYAAAFKKQGLAYAPTGAISTNDLPKPINTSTGLPDRPFDLALAYTQVGVTPFQANLFSRNFNI